MAGYFAEIKNNIVQRIAESNSIEECVSLYSGIWEQIDTPPYKYWKVVDGILIDVTDNVDNEITYCSIEPIYGNN